MFRKQQLDLIIAALLPVSVLGIGFLVFSTMAALNPGESANPAASGDYYRTPGKDGKWFGPEVLSDTLCAGQNSQYNQGQRKTHRLLRRPTLLIGIERRIGDLDPQHHGVPIIPTSP